MNKTARLMQFLSARRHLLAAGAGFALFALALWVLHRELANIHLADIRRAVDQVPYSSLTYAILGTLGSYLALTGYDVLALRHLGRPLPYPRVAQISFMATAVGHNLGMAMLSAGMVRLRFYTAAGLSATEVAAMAALIGLTFGIGATFAAGLAMLLEPAEAGLLLHLPESTAGALGWMLLALIGGYFLSGWLRQTPIRIGGWQLHPPRASIAVGQLALASVDLACAAAALYWLLPADSNISYSTFLGIYVLAIVAGIASHVPAGLGVFETVMLLALPHIPKESLLAAIIAYRSIYYLAPLALAASMAAGGLMRERGHLIAHHLDWARGLFAWIAPVTASTSVFITGSLLMFSGSTPALAERMALLRDFVPLPLLEVSHLAGSLAGLGLVILARALYRRVDAAYHLAFWLLAAGAAASLLKGLDYEEALLSLVVLGILRLGREAFNRPASLIDRSFSPGWIFTVLLVLLASFWLGMFSYKHVDYAGELWWQFAFSADAPRFMRTMLLLAMAAAAIGLMRLLRPAPPEPSPPSAADIERAAQVVARAPESEAALALLGDKRLLFSPEGDAFIMYQVQGASWVVMGDPVGPASRHEALAWRLREMADRHGGRAVFYQVQGQNLPLYLDMGLTAMKLGEEAIVPLAGFSLDGSARKELRQTHRRAQREGLSFEIVQPEKVADLMDEFRNISDAWLQEKHTREKGFALGRFETGYLSRFPCALIRRQGRIVAFANVWSSADRNELSIDLMRRLPDAPNGVMDYLFIELMLWGAREGYAQFNLGMAPLSGLEDHPLAPLWHRLGTLLYRQGEYFYNFEGLRAYKNKFDPVWRPKYLATPGGLSMPTILLDVATLIAGGIKGIFTH